ncbi:MFS transporter [Haloarchaeobius sp. TZWSO28]|uniref:MFS transporter n=1 Tax=Haloarchaeobius sp. TZWSO28 TaxID=3446119 RepID=UPI003EBDA94F
MTGEEPTGTRRERIEHWTPLAVVCSAMVITVIDTTMMTVAISAIVADLDTSVTAVQGAISLYALVMAAFMMLGAKLGNVYGVRRMFRIGLVIYGVGTVLAAVSWNIYALLLGWSVLEGLGAAILLPLAYAMLPILYTDPKERALAFGVLTGVLAGAAAVGPILGGTLTTYFTWRLGFALEAVIAVPTFFFAARLAEYRPEKGAAIDVVGTALSVLGLGTLVVGVLLSGRYGWWGALRPVSVGGVELGLLGLSPTPILVAAGLSLLVGFLHWQRARERRGETPLVKTSIFQNGGYLAGLSTYFVSWIALGGILFVLPVFLQGALGYTAFDTGIALLPFSLSVFVVSIGTAKFTQSVGGKRLIQLGVVVLALGLAALFVVTSMAMTTVELVVPLLLVGVGIGLVLANIVNLTLSTVEAEETMEASGVSMAVNWLGTSVGTAVVGSFLLTATYGSVVEQILSSAGLGVGTGRRRELVVLLQDATEFLTEAERQALLAQLPTEVQQALDGIVEQAMVQGFRNTVLLVGVFVLLLGLTSTFLPTGKSQVQPAEPTPPDVVPDRADD